jgi:hypothetical protein
VEHKTKTINNSTDPEWNEVGLRDFYFLWKFHLCYQVFEFAVEQYQSDNVEFEVFDEDPGKDDFIGR